MSATNYFMRVDRSEGSSGEPVRSTIDGRTGGPVQSANRKMWVLESVFVFKRLEGIVHDVTVGTNAIADTVKGCDAGAGLGCLHRVGNPGRLCDFK